MMDDNTCLIWEKTEIIDLPFFPLGTDKEILERVIAEATKRIKCIRNGKFRLDGEEEQFNKRFFFYKTDTLLGVDISTLDTSSRSYFDALPLVLKMYPMVFINSYMNDVEVTTLHSYCMKKCYILPVFSQIPFLDKANSKKYAHLKIEALIKGEEKSIVIKDNKPENQDFDIEEFKIRFPQFSVLNNERVTFEPKITWLGVSDKNIEALLNKLFNENISKFKISEVCTEYLINESVLKEYVSKSMLFFSEDGENCTFRLLRKNIYWGFVCNLANQFEQELIERNAIFYDFSIESKIGEEKDIQETVYHRVGNLFVKKDAYSYKLFSFLKRLVEEDPETCIVIVDNGNMDELESNLLAIDLRERVFKILDYYGEAVKFTIIDYNKLKGKNLIIVIDVINTGRLIESVIGLVEEIGCNNITVFSYIVNENFRWKNVKTKKDIKWWYLTEKKLSNVKNILYKDYEDRFIKDVELNFKMLWGNVGNAVELCEITDNVFYRNRNDCIKDEYNFLLNGKIDKYSYIYQKLKRILRDFTLVLISDSYGELTKLIETINKVELNSNIQIKIIKEKDINIVLNGEDEFDNLVALLIMPVTFMEKNISNIKRYMQVKNIQKWKGLKLVNCELYSLEDNIMIDEKEDNIAIFNSNLRRYLAFSDNPLLKN